MSKIKDVKSTEYHPKMFRGVRAFQKSSGTNAVEPASATQYASKDPLPNQVYNIAILYEHASQMKKAFKNLTDRERRLKDSIKFAKKHVDELYNILTEIVKCFNQASASLLSFDRCYGTTHADTLRNLINQYQFTLSGVGIRIIGINQLQIDELIFRTAIHETPHRCFELCIDEDNFFEKAYVFFYDIRIPKSSMENGKYQNGIARTRIFDKKG